MKESLVFRMMLAGIFGIMMKFLITQIAGTIPYVIITLNAIT